MELMRTSQIPVQSSIHGRERRNQREINKRDLQAAVKYGKKERGFPHPRTGELRWKYTYADIVYITDFSSTVEVTSWALEQPLDKVDIPPRLSTQNEEAKKRLQKDPDIITSHIVIIVDKSASMNKSDMNGHRTRARGVYYTLAEDFLAPQLSPLDSHAFSGNFTTFTDVVTLIEMRGDPTIVFYHEPINWILYNKLVDMSTKNDARFHGNYYPSFEAAFDYLSKSNHPCCSLSLFMLTDGRPSDLCTSPYSGFPNNLINLISQKSSEFRGRFTFGAVGYGTDESEFTLLTQLIHTAKVNGAEVFLTNGTLDPEELGKVLKSVVTSTTRIRSTLSRIQPLDDPSQYVMKKVDKTMNKTQATHFIPSQWNIYNGNCHRYTREYIRKRDGGVMKYVADWSNLPFIHPEATGFAVRKEYFGEGAERLVFEMTEIDRNRHPVGVVMVAKKTILTRTNKNSKDEVQSMKKGDHAIFIETLMKASKYAKGLAVRKEYFGEGAEKLVFEMKEIDRNRHPVGVVTVAKETKLTRTNKTSKDEVQSMKEGDHAIFIETQMKASKYAKVFNRRLDSLQVSPYIPRIEFLECAVYCLDDYSEEYLCEAYLDPPTAYKKWNDNSGHIDGIAKVKLNVNIPLPMAPRKLLYEQILEGDDEDNETDNQSLVIMAESNNVATITHHLPGNRTISSTERDLLVNQILEGDIPQAFSHFTHVISLREHLVCDLQGMITCKGPDNHPVFKMTDPCIHTVCPPYHRRRRYGRTDRGYVGVKDFFRTHECNPVCKLLRLH